ncbi:hypothetical protein AYI69_g1314 [Smittium culicis]|uniref:A to I editase domain-containing protein n=1 Tax=Smittium culicis TaxID=133412 RepID=A0A1R1YQM2_9FUNG|nr:hypothetical protein AYI69_g1314 [Smittium culicis]
MKISSSSAQFQGGIEYLAENHPGLSQVPCEASINYFLSSDSKILAQSGKFNVEIIVKGKKQGSRLCKLETYRSFRNLYLKLIPTLSAMNEENEHQKILDLFSKSSYKEIKRKSYKYFSSKKSLKDQKFSAWVNKPEFVDSFTL